MDGSRFDLLTRELAGGSTRRSVLKRSLAVVLGVGSIAATNGAGAAVLRNPGEVCRKGSDCTSGICANPDRTGRRYCQCGDASHCPTRGTTPCKVATCNDGVCGVVQLAAGQSCNDGNACTTGDVCDAQGQCHGFPLKCANDSNPCTVTICDPKIGCVERALTAAEMDDNNKCTRDYCDPDLGIVHEQIICTTTNKCEVASCDPAIGCTTKPKVCNDNNPCTFDSCNPETGECVFSDVSIETADRLGIQCT